MLENPAGLVYGTLVVGALLDAESAANETYGETVLAVLAAMLLAWLAHSYAEYAGHRLEHRHPLELRELVRALYRGRSVLVGAAVPAFTLVICWAAGVSLSTAVTIGIYDSAVVLLVIEVAAGVRAQLTGIALLFQAAVGATLGGLIIGLKLILH